jgi:hypothetical protein
MTRLEQLYTEAGELLRAGDPWRAADRVGLALLELEGIRAARSRSRAPLRRAIPARDAQADDLGNAAERLRALAHDVRLAVDRLEEERRLTRGQRRLGRAFAAGSGDGPRELDRSA